MRAPRNYKAEYARRIARGLAKGQSRSQARGHPKAGEGYASPRTSALGYDPRLEEGLKALRNGESLAQAARSLHVSSERLSHYIRASGVRLEKRKGRWRIGQDVRVRELPIFSRGKEQVIRVRGYAPAVDVGRYMAAVGRFLETNDPGYLAPFEGLSVTDVSGQSHALETRPNVLYRLDQAGGAPFEQVYRIVV